nr:hypothetical protein [Tanacetum cinerariifolium]
RLPFYRTSPTVVDASASDPTPKDLAAGNPSAKVVAKAKASQKRKASTSSATSSPVSKHTSDNDACIEIPLVTPIHAAAVILSSGNQSRGFATSVAEADHSLHPTLLFLFRDISGDVIHRDFFPFSLRPYYATYLEGGVAGNYEFSHEEWDASHQHTLTILTKELTAKMSVLQYLMMSHSGELLAWYRGLLQSHHELQRHVVGLNDKLASFDAAFSKYKAKGKERKKKIKSLTKSLDNLHAKVARLSADLNRATILEAERDEEILRLKASPPEFASFFRVASAGFERGLSMHQTKKEFSAILEKISQADDANLGSMFVQGASHDVNDDAELTLIGSERVSSNPSDVIVAFSIGGKGDGSLPSSVVDEEGRVICRRTFVALSLGKTDCRCMVVHPADPESCHPPEVKWLSPGTFSTAGQASVGSMGPISLPEAKIVLSCSAFELAWLLLFLPSFIGIPYMFSPRRCCSSELFAQKEEVVVTPPVLLPPTWSTNICESTKTWPSSIIPMPEPSLLASLLNYNLHAFSVEEFLLFEEFVYLLSFGLVGSGNHKDNA